MTHAVQFRNVDFGYTGHGISLFSNLSLSIPTSRRTVVWGDSGIGKSTLLSLITAELSPQRGTVTRDQSTIGVVFQENGLYPWLSALDNVTIGLSEHVNRDRIERGKAALSMVGLHSQVAQRADTLSGGEKRRVQLARLIASEAQLWILDEPFAGVDFKSRCECREQLLKLQDDANATLVMATHSVEDVENCAETLLLLRRDGRDSTAVREKSATDWQSRRELIEILA